MSGVRRVDQRMASAAGRLLPATIPDGLLTRYKQLPVQLRMSGLAATYAYVVAKSDTDDLGQAYAMVADGIRRHLTDVAKIVTGDTAAATNEGFLRALGELEPSSYARASAEAQSLALWLSRLGEARYRSQNPGGRES